MSGEVFLCQAGQLSPASRRELKRGGIIVVEVEDISQCRFMRASETISGDDMLWAAMDALRKNFGYSDKGEKQREAFTFNIWELLRAARGGQQEVAP